MYNEMNILIIMLIIWFYFYFKNKCVVRWYVFWYEMICLWEIKFIKNMRISFILFFIKLVYVIIRLVEIDKFVIYIEF